MIVILFATHVNFTLTFYITTISNALVLVIFPLLVCEVAQKVIINVIFKIFQKLEALSREDYLEVLKEQLYVKLAVTLK